MHNINHSYGTELDITIHARRCICAWPVVQTAAKGAVDFALSACTLCYGGMVLVAGHQSCLVTLRMVTSVIATPPPGTIRGNCMHVVPPDHPWHCEQLKNMLSGYSKKILTSFHLMNGTSLHAPRGITGKKCL